MDRIQFRRDTLANWNSVNPILLEGEIGYVLDDPNLYKMGDGVHTWNQLPFRGFDGTIVHETGYSENAVMSQKAVTARSNEFALLITRGSSYINVNTTDRTITIPGNYSIVYADTNYRIPSSTNVIVDIGTENNGKIIFDSETFSFSRVSVDYKNKMNEYTLFLYTANPYFTHLTLSPFQYEIDNVPYFTKVESAYNITRLAKVWVTGGTYCTWDRVANTITIPKGSVVKTGFSTYTLEDSVTISEITGNSGYVVFHPWYKTFKRMSSTLNPTADEFIVCYYNNLEYGPYISLQPCTIINSNDDLKTLLTGGDYNQWIRQLQKPLRGSTQTSLVLLHFSDIHAHSANLSTINKVVNDAYFKLGTIDDVISTGDQAAQYYTDDFSFWSENGGNNFLQVIGNHETWKGGEEHASELDTYNKYFSPYIDSWGASYISGKCYYYKDYTNKNIRLIVLDCMHYDDNQNNWFIDALEDARSKNYTVVCAAHYIAGYPILMQDSAFCTLDYNQEAVLDYRAPLAVNEFINNGGDFACWIGGHYHKDILYTIDGYDNQVGVCIDAAFPYNDNADAYRTPNTYLYNLMNFISIDAVDGKFKIVRVGCNIDRYMRQKNMLCYDWRNKKLISSI